MSEYATLKPLISQVDGKLSQTDVRKSVNQLAKTVSGARKAGRFGLLISDGRSTHQFAVDLVDGDGKVTDGRPEDCTFELTCDTDTWAEVAAGTLSPVDAYYGGRMVIQGDLDFARRLYAKAARRGETDF